MMNAVSVCDSRSAVVVPRVQREPRRLLPGGLPGGLHGHARRHALQEDPPDGRGAAQAHARPPRTGKLSAVFIIIDNTDRG